MYYSVIGILAATILIVENLDILSNRNNAFNLPAWILYRRFLFAVLVYYITDILWGFLESRKLSFLLFADTSFYFLTMALGIVFWSLYVITYLNENNRFARVLISAAHIVALLITILTIINIFVPVLFTVDEHCVYNALSPRYVALTCQIIILLVLSLYAFLSIIRKEQSEKKDQKYRTVALFGLIMAMFLTAQIWFPYLPLYSIGYLLGTCLIRAIVIANEKEEYRSELKEAEKIRELKESISALLDNMPALSFYKDAKSGVYLACNQAFAEYAHKEKPEGVVGLTDAGIFDAETARHFVEDDRMALSMDKPYIFFEDVPDAAGNQKQFQTTKLKFIDDNGRLCILGMCQDVTEMVRIQRAAERVKEDHIAYARLNALSGDFLCVYVVDPESEEYREFSSTDGIKGLEIPESGSDFFKKSREQIAKNAYPGDSERILTHFTKETVLSEIKRKGVFVISYSLMINGDRNYVQLKAVMLEEEEGERLIVGINDIDALVRHEEDYAKRLAQAQSKANIDALTGVKNKHAYLDEEEMLDEHIVEDNAEKFAIVIMDVNDLKKINDSLGHQAGDQCIKDACHIICDTFKKSPVFRVGGDEFAVVAQGNDYECIDELMERMNLHNEEASRSGGVVIACGMSKFDKDECVAAVFERADQDMYENKQRLKSINNAAMQ